MVRIFSYSNLVSKLTSQLSLLSTPRLSLISVTSMSNEVMPSVCPCVNKDGGAKIPVFGMDMPTSAQSLGFKANAEQHVCIRIPQSKVECKAVWRNAEEIFASIFIFMFMMCFPTTRPFSVHLDISKKQVLAFRLEVKLLIVQSDSVDVIDDVFPIEVFLLQRILRHGSSTLRSSDAHRADRRL